MNNKMFKLTQLLHTMSDAGFLTLWQGAVVVAAAVATLTEYILTFRYINKV